MKSHNTLSKRIGVLVVVLLLAVLGVWAWWVDGGSPVDSTDTTPIIFVVRRGEGARTIATNLANQNLIRSPTAFFLSVKFLGIEHNLQAGDFRLNKGMSTSEIAQNLTHGFIDVWVTILEGWRVEEVASRLVKDLDIPEGEFLKVAQEGYMFPDTYLIPREATAAGVAKIFSDTFNQKVTSQMQDDASKLGLTLDEVVILASIVEREGRTQEDRPVIAGILLNRLNAGWPLQADATLQYSLGYQASEKSWWKKALTLEDKTVRSPYNTYLSVGLPPGPIASPGLAAIRSVIYHTKSDYWFYLHDPEGGVHYAETIEGHNANIAAYLQ